MVSKDFPFLAELNRTIEAYGPHIQRLHRLYKVFLKVTPCISPPDGPRPLYKRFARLQQHFNVMRMFAALNIYVGPLFIYAIGMTVAACSFGFEFAYMHKFKHQNYKTKLKYIFKLLNFNTPIFAAQTS